MRLIDYDLIKELQTDPGFVAYLKEHPRGKLVPALMHYLVENHGYSQTDAYRMAHAIAAEVLPDDEVVRLPGTTIH